MHEAGALLRVAGPIILSQLGTVGMNTMDTLMVGPLGATSLAAAGLGTALHSVLLMMSMGLLFGMTPLVSQSFGAGDRLELRRVVVQGFWLALFTSVPLVLYNLLGGRLALAFGQPPEIADLAGSYMGALAAGVPSFLLFIAARQYLEGMGRTTPAMVITFLALGANYFANRAFIYGVPGWIEPMGVAGAGWATSLVRTLMMVMMALYILTHPRLRPFRGVPVTPARQRLRRIIAVGAPTGAQVGLESGLFSFTSVMMGWFGAVEQGTHQVTINIASTTFMVALGTSIAGSIRVGMHIGARNPAAVRRAIVVTYAVSLGFMGLCALLFVLMPDRLVGLYTDDVDIIALGRQLLLMAALFQLFDGAQVAGFSVLRGAADTRVPMLLALVAFWGLGGPAAYLLGFAVGLGPVGVWAGLCLGLAGASVLLARRVRHVLWRAPARPAFRPDDDSRPQQL